MCEQVFSAAVAPSSTCDLAGPTFAKYVSTSPFTEVRALGMVTSAAVSADGISCTPFSPPGARIVAASAMAPALGQGPATAH